VVLTQRDRRNVNWKLTAPDTWSEYP
jgi:hypothetical protein